MTILRHLIAGLFAASMLHAQAADAVFDTSTNMLTIPSVTIHTPFGDSSYSNVSIELAANGQWKLVSAGSGSGAGGGSAGGGSSGGGNTGGGSTGGTTDPGAGGGSGTTGCDITAGSWTGDYTGALTFAPNTAQANGVVGSYPAKSGKFIGTYDKTSLQFSGYFTESGVGGRASLQFSADCKSFSGTLSHGDAPNNVTTNITGERK